MKKIKMACAPKKKKLKEQLETQNEFMQKCISAEMKKGHPQKQAIRICYEIWRSKK